MRVGPDRIAFDNWAKAKPCAIKKGCEPESCPLEQCPDLKQWKGEQPVVMFRTKHSALDCPVNCGFLILAAKGCACKLGVVPRATIGEEFGGGDS